MSKRKVYNVLPDSNDWQVKLQGNKKATKLFENKEKAIGLAKKLAKKAKLGQVKIHNAKGKIQTEYTYGNDPVKTKG